MNEYILQRLLLLLTLIQNILRLALKLVYTSTKYRNLDGDSQVQNIFVAPIC